MNAMTPLVYACRAMNEWVIDRGRTERGKYLDALQKPIEEERKRMIERINKIEQKS